MKKLNGFDKNKISAASGEKIVEDLRKDIIGMIKIFGKYHKALGNAPGGDDIEFDSWQNLVNKIVEVGKILEDFERLIWDVRFKSED